jgi:cell division septation protein DedD
MASKNSRNFEFKLGKQALVAFILGMSLLLFGVFLFGVMVGKHIDAYPEIIARGIPDMIREKLGFGKGKGQAELALQGEDTGDVEEGEFDLTFYDTLAKKRTTSTNAARRVKAGVETAKAPAAVSGVTPGIVSGGVSGNAPGKASGNGPGNGHSNGIDKKPLAGVAGNTNSSEAGRQAGEGNGGKATLSDDAGQSKNGTGTRGKGFIIHVASFREKVKSDQLAKKIAALGYAANVQTWDLPQKGKWFRVVVSDFKTREEAQKVIDAVGTKIPGLKATILAAGEKQN